MSASKDAEIGELKAVVAQLQLDSKKKDERIRDMERAVQNRSVSDRLDTVKEHGTIEELVRQVAALTTTVRSLQMELKKKDQIIEKLLSSETSQHIQDENVYTELPEHGEMFHSQTSNCELLTKTPTLDSTTTQSVANWIEASALSDCKGPKKDKIKQQPKLNKDGYLSDTSIASQQSIQTITSTPSKRGHASSSSSGGESSNYVTGAKRASKAGKANPNLRAPKK